MCDEEIDWEVDGGFNASNIRDAVAAGASIVVAGRGVFGGEGIAFNLAALRKAALE